MYRIFKLRTYKTEVLSIYALCYSLFFNTGSISVLKITPSSWVGLASAMLLARAFLPDTLSSERTPIHTYLHTYVFAYLVIANASQEIFFKK